jgi:hypothetical protein
VANDSSLDTREKTYALERLDPNALDTAVFLMLLSTVEYTPPYWTTTQSGVNVDNKLHVSININDRRPFETFI